MTDRLTDAEMDRLEGLHAAATPGQWESDVWGDVTANSEVGPVVISVFSHRMNGELIAAARNALPALIAEVREHRAREAAHRAALDTLVDGDGR